MSTEREELVRIVREHLATYRALPHSELARRLESSGRDECVDVVDGLGNKETAYTIETNILWDDRSRLSIRVISSLSTGKGGCLFGLLPIFTPDVVEDFILAPDGSFIGE